MAFSRLGFCDGGELTTESCEPAAATPNPWGLGVQALRVLKVLGVLGFPDFLGV